MFNTLKESLEAKGWKVAELRKQIVLKFSKAPPRQTLVKTLDGESCPSLEIALMIHRAMDEDFNIVSLIPANKLKYLEAPTEEVKQTSDDLLGGIDVDDLLGDMEVKETEGAGAEEDDLLGDITLN